MAAVERLGLGRDLEKLFFDSVRCSCFRCSCFRFSSFRFSCFGCSRFFGAGAGVDFFRVELRTEESLP